MSGGALVTTPPPFSTFDFTDEDFVSIIHALKIEVLDIHRWTLKLLPVADMWNVIFKNVVNAFLNYAYLENKEMEPSDLHDVETIYRTFYTDPDSQLTFSHIFESVVQAIVLAVCRDNPDRRNSRKISDFIDVPEIWRLDDFRRNHHLLKDSAKGDALTIFHPSFSRQFHTVLSKLLDIPNSTRYPLSKRPRL